MAPVASPSNPYKKQIDAVQRIYDCAKRRKTSHDSGDFATSTVHNEPALVPTSVSENAEATESGSDDESWVSESSEEPSDESSDEDTTEGEDDDPAHGIGEVPQQDAEEVVNLRANRGNRPDFRPPGNEELEDIRPFLKDFLPKLKAANEELEAQRKAGTLQSSEILGDEDGEGEEQYIEMNLGLGVLEERDDNADGDTHKFLDGGSESDNEKEQGQEKDVLGKLMGRQKLEEPIGIQEVANAEGNI